MKRSTNIALVCTLTALLIVIFSVIYFLSHKNKDFPFRCSTFSRYDLSRSAEKNIEFAISHDLRFETKSDGYLLLNGQAEVDGHTFILNRRIVFINGAKLDDDTYKYKIDEIITSTIDNTPNEFFNLLLAEITLDPSYLQLDVDKVDEGSYLIGGPLSYLFICQRY
ncbi:FidL-like putative membrane protein [Kosakonia arachidis]|uniref:FidL-like putative membrane protein n=1 Tax=Kosakonia arachidis TaxID=551989 RepID=A0A1I6ZJ04_9ENTR|nr:FidL-like protein [Kosakonia arachidis]SFT62670.1 FidL-like putative membrane protein [Kosakonia arachidis]